MGTLAQSSPTMQGLLVLASLTVISAQILPYGGLGYPYGYSGLGLGYGGLGLPYTYGANIVKPVAKEIEVPVLQSSWRPLLLDALTPSVTLYLVFRKERPGRRERRMTRLKLRLLPLPPFFLLDTLVSDTPVWAMLDSDMLVSDTLVWDITVLDTLVLLVFLTALPSLLPSLPPL